MLGFLAYATSSTSNQLCDFLLNLDDPGMKKKILVVILLLLGLGLTLLIFTILSNTRATKTETHFPEKPSVYRSALEAYQVIGPTMRDWNEDAYVVDISAPLWWVDTPEWDVQPDGRIAWWVITVVSPSAESVTQIFLVDDQIVVGVEGIPGEERPSSGKGVAVPVDAMLDSIDAIRISRKMSIESSLYGMRLGRYDNTAGEEIPLSWIMKYRLSEGGVAEVYIDVVTGEVIRNDFLSPLD
jgi:hypothetical protein